MIVYALHRFQSLFKSKKVFSVLPMLEASHLRLSHFKIPNHNDHIEAASCCPHAVCALDFVLVQGLMRKGWVKLFANEQAWRGPHTGVVGVTAGMGIITCILCKVSPLYICLYYYLTISLDMWCSILLMQIAVNNISISRLWWGQFRSSSTLF